MYHFYSGENWKDIAQRREYNRAGDVRRPVLAARVYKPKGNETVLKRKRVPVANLCTRCLVYKQASQDWSALALQRAPVRRKAAGSGNEGFQLQL